MTLHLISARIIDCVYASKGRSKISRVAFDSKSRRIQGPGHELLSSSVRANMSSKSLSSSVLSLAKSILLLQLHSSNSCARTLSCCCRVSSSVEVTKHGQHLHLLLLAFSPTRS